MWSFSQIFLDSGIFLDYILMYDKRIKTIPENKLEEDTMAKKQKSSEAEPTPK